MLHCQVNKTEDAERASVMQGVAVAQAAGQRRDKGDALCAVSQFSARKDTPCALETHARSPSSRQMSVLEILLCRICSIDKRGRGSGCDRRVQSPFQMQIR